MALNLKAKKEVVAEVSEIAKSSIAVGVAHYHGLTALEMTGLRNLARETHVVLKTVKNTLAKRAISGTRCQCISPVLSGPVVLAFSKEDPGAVARVFSQFSKGNKKLVVNGLGVEGIFIEPDRLNKIATIPTKEQAIGLLMAVMMAPTEKLARVFAEIPAKITRVVSVISSKK